MRCVCVCVLGGEEQTFGSMQRKLTLLFILSNDANKPVLWGLAHKASNWGKSYLLWAHVVGRHAVLCAAHAHPDLGSDQNTLNQLGLNEGHFPRLLSYTCGKCLVSKDGETEPKTRTMQQQWWRVYNTRKQQHWLHVSDIRGTTAREF